MAGEKRRLSYKSSSNFFYEREVFCGKSEWESESSTFALRPTTGTGNEKRRTLRKSRKRGECCCFVICASCAGYGLGKSFFSQLFLSKRTFWWINSFPVPQYCFYNPFDRYLKWLFILSVSRQKHNCEVKKYSHVDTEAYCFKREL